MQHLAGDAPAADSAERLEQRRERRANMPRRRSRHDKTGSTDQIDALPHAYASSSPPERIAAELRDLPQPGRLATCMPAAAICRESHTVEFVVGTHERYHPGVFHKLTGALASQGLQILSAEINTLADGLVLDRFYVQRSRLCRRSRRRTGSTKSTRALVRVAANRHRIDARRFARCGAAPPAANVPRSITLPTRVLIDNSTSDRFTIIDVFASDRMGLLFTIARTLFEMGLVGLGGQDRHVSRPGRRRVLCHRSRGRKITDEQRLQQIIARLLEAIDGMDND